MEHLVSQCAFLQACDGFWCPPAEGHEGDCILADWVCDGYFDCPDGADEDLPECKENCQTVFCKLMVVPLSGCMQKEGMCDGFIDCEDGSDENEECRQWLSMIFYHCVCVYFG